MKERLNFLKQLMEKVNFLYTSLEEMIKRQRKIVVFIKYLLFLIVVIYFLKLVYEIKDKIVSYIFNIHLPFAGIAILCIFLSFIIYTMIWHLTLLFLGKGLPFLTLFKINIVSLFFRYLPGGVGDHIGRYAMLSQRGVEKKITIFSIGLLAGMLVFAGILFFFMIHPFPLFHHFGEISNVTFIIGILVVLFILFAPKIIKYILNTSPFGYKEIIFLLILSLLHWILWGTGAFYSVKAIHPISYNLWLKVVSIGVISWVIGFLTPFAPNGIGVRELVFIFLLKEIVPYPIAVSSSLFFRGVGIASDILYGVLILPVFLFLKRRRQE